MSEAIHTDWSDAPFTADPLAPAVGPFPHRPFLEAWWRHEGGDDRLALAPGLQLRESGNRILFVGDADVTDYHSPLGNPAPAVETVARRFAGLPFALDSMPVEAAEALHYALDEGGHDHVVTRDAITVVLDLPNDPDEWLARLDKKERHEIRRKRRRFEELLGRPRLERHTDAEAIALFAAMHRSAPGAKGGFMTPQREAFFADLAASAGATVDVLATGEGAVAAAFGFPEADGYYLYNSAFAPEAAATSPGIVLLAALIERLIAEGSPRLDLLKGDEAYKFRLGGTKRQLYRIEGMFA